jgi:protein-tyrosine sulfotransferase
MNEKRDESKIIFIMGIMPRSGTHFLANLLCQHPGCTKSVIAEDALTENADFLARYAASLQQQWRGQTDSTYPGASEILLKNLGDGLINFLIEFKKKAFAEKAKEFNFTLPAQQQSTKRLVTKTPSVANLDKFFKLFPNEKLLVIVRDGRAVVESCAVSFGFDREETTRDWKKAAARILRFQKDEQLSSGKYLIVKCEDLHAQTESEMRKILQFLELDCESYPFEKSLDLPVVGSSEFKRGRGGVHWLPVRKTGNFNPLARAASWERAEHERFNWLAKNELIELGYEAKEFAGQAARWKIRNKFLDLRWEARIWLKRIFKLARIIKKRFGVYFGKRR